MKFVPLMSVVVAIVMATPVLAADPNVPNELTSGCNQQANQRKLKGVDREAYMEKCTAPATIYPATENAPIPEELRIGCEQKADSHKLNGADRDAFLKDCTTYKNTRKLTTPAIPKEKVNSCVNQANEKKLKGADRKTFIMDCFSN